MSTITTKNGKLIYYNERASKPSIVFSHRCPLSTHLFEAAIEAPIALEGTLVVGICALVAFIADEHCASADASGPTDTGV
jgi:hypothetical protein